MATCGAFSLECDGLPNIYLEFIILIFKLTLVISQLVV